MTKSLLGAAALLTIATAAAAQTTAPDAALGRWARDCAQGPSMTVTRTTMVLRNGADTVTLPLRSTCPTCVSTPEQPWVTAAVDESRYVAMQLDGNAATVDRWNAGPMASRFPISQRVNRCPA